MWQFYTKFNLIEKKLKNKFNLVFNIATIFYKFKFF